MVLVMLARDDEVLLCSNCSLVHDNRVFINQILFTRHEILSVTIFGPTSFRI